MVRKAVRTYSQILADFARVDEEDARIRAFYEPSGARAPARPSADPDEQKKRPASASRKHRYAYVLDWNDDVSAIVNVDKHDGGARTPGAHLAAFAADRRGSASRALTAALSAAMETASRLHNLPAAPTSTHTSRLAMRLLRAAQTPLPVPASPRADVAPNLTSGDPRHPPDPAGSIAARTSATPGSTSRPTSPVQGEGSTARIAAGSVTVPSGSVNLNLEVQQQQAIASGTLLNRSSRMLYYGSSKPRVSSARGRPGGNGGSSGRPISAPSQQSAPSVVQLPLGRAALTATWAPSPSSARSRPSSARPASARPISPHIRHTSPPVSTGNSGGGGARATVRGPTITSLPLTPALDLADSAGAAAAAAPPLSSPAVARHSAPRSSFSSFGGGGGAAAVSAMAGGVTAIIPADTARSLGVNPKQLHQVQPKHGPSNGVVVRDPVGPQLVPNRRVVLMRPFSAPPGGGPASGDADTGDGGVADPTGSLESPGGGTHAAATQQKQQLQQRERQQQQMYPPSPSWQPNQQRQRAGSSSPPRNQQEYNQQRDGGRVSSPPPGRQSGGGDTSPRRGNMGRNESSHSMASAHSLGSVPSCGSLAIAAAAAAADAAVSAGVTRIRCRHAALAGARKTLWAQITDAAGVMPHEPLDVDGGAYDEFDVLTTAAAAATSYMEAYLGQQAVAESSSGSNSRLHSRMGSPDPLLSSHQQQLRQYRSNRIADADVNFSNEPSAAHLLTSPTFALAPAAALDDAGDAATVTEIAAMMYVPYRGAEQAGGGGGGDEPPTPTLRRTSAAAGAHGSMPRLPSGVIKRPHASGGGGGGDDEAAVTPGGSKRVQWGANVWSPQQRPQQQHAVPASAAASAAAAAFLDLDRELSGIARGPNSGEGGSLVTPGRPPRFPVLTLLDVGSERRGGGSECSGGGEGSGEGELVLAGGAISPVSSVSSGCLGSGGSGGGGGGNGSGSNGGRHAAGRKPPPLPSFSRLQVGRESDVGGGGDDEDDDGSDLPSLEVSTTVGVLDRAAQSPRAMATGAVTGRGGGGSSGGDAPQPRFTDPEYYYMTATVDRSEEMRGWLFNVYLTDIVPGNPLARRICIATCTTINEHRQLLVPAPPLRSARGTATTAALSARRRPTSAPSSSSQHDPTIASAAPAAPLPSPRPLWPLSSPSPLISPAELLPWVSRPEQLLGHWLRLEAFAIAPVADKVVDASTFMGRLDGDGPSPAPPPPLPPKVSKLQVVDIRPAAAAASGSGNRPASASLSSSAAAAAVDASTGLAAALGRQVSSAGNAAQAQARLAATVALTAAAGGQQRPGSAARVRRGAVWA